MGAARTTAGPRKAQVISGFDESLRVMLPAVEEGRHQAVAQLGASPTAGATKKCEPFPFLPLHAHPHRFPLSLHLKEEDLAGLDVDGLAAWRRDRPLARGEHYQRAFGHGLASYRFTTSARPTRKSLPNAS